MTDYASLRFTEEFLESFSDRRFTAADRRAILKALRVLDSNERHTSLRVHALSGDMEGLWSASGSRSLRIIFERLDDGGKRLISCSHHYDA